MSTSRTREKADKATFTQAEVTAGDTAARAGRKNLIINGGMQVAQRGTTAVYSGNTSRGFVCDRWFAEGYPLNMTVTQSTLTYNGIDYKSSSLSSITGSWKLFHAIENGRVNNHNKTLTFSFVASGSGSIQPISWGGAQRTFGSSITLTGTPTHYEITHTLESAATGDHLYIGFSGSGGSMNVTNVQLELGSVATDFEHRSYGEELALCQRYYEVCYAWQQGMATGASQYVAAASVLYAVPKRALPTLSVTAGGFGSVVKISVTGQRNSSTSGFGLQGISTASGEIYSDTKVTADAEL